MYIKNFPKLREVLAAIDPKHFDMKYWFISRGIRIDGVPKEELLERLFSRDECGTVACLAGWTCALYPREVNHTLAIRENAAQILGIEGVGRIELFNTLFWPEKFRHAYYESSSPEHRLSVLRKYVDYLEVLQNGNSENKI